ncbi:MAG: hypothetical protein K8W52_16695 [Deltaproteobacteria bacterium]|nr:hypothetical protein [Deltaproteobacteria bacterium]
MSWIARAGAVMLLLVGGVAQAETDPCAVPPADPATRAMTIDLVDNADWGYQTFAPGTGAAFPAVSKDGKTLVQLFQDGEDFTGAPITTIVFWSTRGAELARYGRGGASDSRNSAAADAPHAHAAVNQRLAATTWRPLAVHNACEPDSEVGRSPSRVTVDGDVAITFDPATARLTKRVAKGRATRIRAQFRAPGLRSADDGIPGGGCGEITRLAYGFGGRDLGVAILIADGNLGGDSCFGQPVADNALVIPLR